MGTEGGHSYLRFLGRFFRILESMVDQEDFSHTSSRPFVQAYNGHARTLLEEGNTIAGTAIGWTVRTSSLLYSDYLKLTPNAFS